MNNYIINFAITSKNSNSEYNKNFFIEDKLYDEAYNLKKYLKEKFDIKNIKLVDRDKNIIDNFDTSKNCTYAYAIRGGICIIGEFDIEELNKSIKNYLSDDIFYQNEDIKFVLKLS